MAKGAQLTGKEFGILTVLAQDINEQNNSQKAWLCTCECGNGTIVTSNRLTSGKTKSCGCLRMPGDNLVGQVFGRLTVISQEENMYGNRAWLCRCECGNGKITITSSLKSGVAKSCGCLVGDTLANWNKNTRVYPKLPKGMAGFKTLLKNYKEGAVKRGLEYSLTEEDFSKLLKGNCNYCGCKPNSKTNPGRTVSNRDKWNTYTYNGIDRVDNDKGYTVENSVTCCKTCNFMKRSMDKNEFVNKALEIAEHQLKNQKANKY